jgi:hypothetical protein
METNNMEELRKEFEKGGETFNCQDPYCQHIYNDDYVKFLLLSNG